MALPVITNNSPVAGSIAWSAFGITFNGVQYPVAAGNTANSFVYWAYNGGSPLMVTTNTLPASLAPEDYFLFLNKTGIGMLVDAAQVTDGSMIVSGSIYAAAIAANQINSNHIVAGAIDTTRLAANSVTANEIAASAVTASEIAAGAIQATHVSAGAITAEKLSVGTVSDNMIVNGSFEDFINGIPVGWEKSAETNGTIVTVTGVNSSGAISVRFDATATTANLRLRQSPAQYIPVSAASGRRYYVSARMAVSVATTVGNYVRINWYDANKVLLTSGGTTDIRGNAALTTTFTLYEGQVTPPAAARYMGVEILLVSPNVVTQMFLDEVTAHEVTMSTQIGDGQITATKILAGTITGDRMAASTITADKILVTDQTNYWENPDFEGDTVGQRARGTTAGNTRVIASGAGGSGKSMEIDALNGSNDDVYGLQQIPVTPGDQWVVRCDYKFLNTAGTGPAGVGFQTFNATKVNVTWTRVVDTAGTTLVAANTARPTAWVDSGWFEYTVPAGTYFLKPWVTFGNNTETTNRFHVDNIIMRRMSGGELIIDGAVTADKIAANSIESGHVAANAIVAGKIAAGAVTSNEIAANTIVAGDIAANTITAGQMAANTITANEIAAGAIVADKLAATAIDGKTITGATVQTAATGARVVMDATGLNAWDADNINYLKADSTGLTMEGLVKVKGFTDYGTSTESMTAYMGNLPYGDAKDVNGNYYDNTAGLHFKRDALNPEQEHARVVSEKATDIYIGSGKEPLYDLGTEGRVSVQQRRIKIETTNNETYKGSILIKTTKNGGPTNEIRVGGTVSAEVDTIELDSPQTTVTGNLSVTGTLNGMDMTDGGRTTVSLSNGWTHFAGGYGYVQAKEYAPGVVLLQGMAKPPTTGRTDGMVIGTLSLALRPNRTHNMPVIIRTNQAMPNSNQPGLLQVNTNGNINLFCDMTYITYVNLSNSFFLVSP